MPGPNVKIKQTEKVSRKRRMTTTWTARNGVALLKGKRRSHRKKHDGQPLAGIPTRPEGEVKIPKPPIYENPENTPLPPFGSREKESRERRKVAARKLRLSAAVGRGLSNRAVLSRWSVTDHTLPHKWLFSFSVGQISAPAYYTFKNVALLGTFLFSNSK